MNSKQRKAWQKLQAATPGLIVPNDEAEVYHELCALGKAWVYEQDDDATTFVAYYEVERIEAGRYSAWKQGPGGWHWCDGGLQIATVEFETHRRRVEDVTGMKAFRVLTTQTVTITVRVHGEDVVLTEKFDGGEKTVMRRILSEDFGTVWLWRQVYYHVKNEARKRGISRLSIMNAESAAWREADRRDTNEDELAARNILRLEQEARNVQTLNYLPAGE